MLLDDVIAGEPGVVEPVAHLVLDVTPVRLPGLVPQAALVPIGTRRDDVADGAILHALHRLEVRRMMPALRARDDAETFLRRLLERLEHRLVAVRIDEDRLLGEHVLAGCNRGLEVRRTEPGGRRENDVVHVGRDDLLERVPPRELPLRRNGGFVAVLREVLETVLQPIGEEIADGVQPDALSGREHVVDRSRAAPARANQTNLDFVRACRPGTRQVHGSGQRAADDGCSRRADEVPSRRRAVRIRGARHTLPRNKKEMPSE